MHLLLHFGLDPWSDLPAPPSAAAWRKSSYSSPSGNCVEAAELAGGIALRDSRRPDGPALVFTSAEWGAFLRGVQDGGSLPFRLRLWRDGQCAWDTPYITYLS